MAAVFAFQATASAAPSVVAKPAAAQSHVLVRAAAAEHKHKSPVQARLRAYDWALTQKGHPYAWGGTGPGYDCSGLVMMAYRHAGIHLPRTTYGMLASHLLVRVRVPKMGDLAFYGSGHVELFRKWGYTYGAHDSGSVVSLIRYGWGWKPTAYYRVRVPVRHHKHHKHHKRHGIII
jgi:murein DD-endopeptidase